jgi:general secretion pathway protein C
MQSLLSRWSPRARPAPRAALYLVVEGLLIVGIAWAAAALFWTLVRPMGPVGRWSAGGKAVAAADPLILTRFDPFFRTSATGPTAVTSLPLKLFGTRLDQAMGRGSAIIATPDGLQSSYAVGDEIVPGVKLKSVAFDSVTIERGGVSEQLFLDQSVAASQPGTPGMAALGSPSPTTLTPQSAGAGIAFTPRMEKGSVTGFVVAPKGTGEAFGASGLQQGDVVTQINGLTVKSADDATRAIGNLPLDGRISFTVDRGGKTVVVSTGARQ